MSPDAGGVERARAFAKRLDASLAIIDKRRARANEVAEMHIVGDVDGQTAVIVDDIVDTAGTLATAAAALREAGATEVIACCTHPVLSGPAIERIRESALTELVVTDTIPLRPEAQDVQQDQGAVRRAPARRSDPAHPPRGIDQLAVRLRRSGR